MHMAVACLTGGSAVISSHYDKCHSLHVYSYITNATLNHSYNHHCAEMVWRNTRWMFTSWHCMLDTAGEIMCDQLKRSGACPTYGILVEFEIWSKFAVLWFKMCSTDHNNILHMSRQCYSPDMQIFLVGGWICHSKVSLNFEFDQNIVSGTGTCQSLRGELSCLHDIEYYPN